MADIIVDKYELDLSGFEGSVSKVITGYDAINQQTKSAAGQNPFKKQADDVLKFNTQLRSGGQLLSALMQNEKALQAEIKRLAAEYLKAAAAQQKADSPLDLKKSQEEIKKLRGEIDALTKQIDKANDQLDKLSKKRKTEPDKKTSGGILGKVTGTVGELATGAGLALGGAKIIRRAVTDSAEYGRKLSELSALTGAAGKDLAFLDQQAQAIEQNTGVVASTILDTFKAVGSIQPALLSNKQALADTTKEVVALA